MSEHHKNEYEDGVHRHENGPVQRAEPHIVAVHQEQEEQGGEDLDQHQSGGSIVLVQPVIFITFHSLFILRQNL